MSAMVAIFNSGRLILSCSRLSTVWLEMCRRTSTLAVLLCSRVSEQVKIFAPMAETAHETFETNLSPNFSGPSEGGTCARTASHRCQIDLVRRPAGGSAKTGVNSERVAASGAARDSPLHFKGRGNPTRAETTTSAKSTRRRRRCCCHRRSRQSQTESELERDIETLVRVLSS